MRGRRWRWKKLGFLVVRLKILPRKLFPKADGRRALAVAFGAAKFWRCDDRDESLAFRNSAMKIWMVREIAPAARVLYEPKNHEEKFSSQHWLLPSPEREVSWGGECEKYRSPVHG